MAATMEAPSQSRAPAPAAPTIPGWITDSRHRYIILGGLLVAIALVAWFVVMSGKRKEQFASRALDQATTIAEQGNLPLAASELQKITTTYGGTAAAQEAVIRLNQVRLVNGQHELAAVGLQDFIKSGPAPHFRSVAYSLLGRALENSGRSADAAAAYTSASESAEVDYLRAAHLLDAGRAFSSAGNRDKAIEAYRRILKDFPSSSARTEAEVRLAELTVGQM
jgi:predicted negative regulator of RcsB-dependent stress response